MRSLLPMLGIIAVLFILGCQPDECKGKDTCYFDKAISSGDQYFCTKIANDAIQKSCFSEIAISSANVERCKEINSSYCVTAIAERLSDPGICNSATDTSWHDVCFKNLAVNLSNSKLCRNITANKQQDECHSILAENLNQTDICLFIRDSSERNGCVMRLAIAHMNSNECYLVEEIVQRDSCYYRIAVRSHKEKICDNIITPDMKKSCKEKTQNKN